PGESTRILPLPNTATAELTSLTLPLTPNVWSTVPSPSIRVIVVSLTSRVFALPSRTTRSLAGTFGRNALPSTNAAFAAAGAASAVPTHSTAKAPFRRLLPLLVPAISCSSCRRFWEFRREETGLVRRSCGQAVEPGRLFDRRGSGPGRDYHQTVESRFSISSSGFV